MHLRGAVGEVDREIAPEVVIVQEIAAHHLRLVAERDDELAEPVRGEDVHDVPEDRTSSDLHHRLGARDGLFLKASAETAGEDDDFHAGASEQRGRTRSWCRAKSQQYRPLDAPPSMDGRPYWCVTASLAHPGRSRCDSHSRAR